MDLLVFMLVSFILLMSHDSHIPTEDIEEVSWKKTDEDEDILVLLYQNNKTLLDSSDEQYRDRVEFFTDEIPKGNFSLRLKSVRTEDKGVYMCQVFAGRVLANATAELKQLAAWSIADQKTQSPAAPSGMFRFLLSFIQTSVCSLPSFSGVSLKDRPILVSDS
ncbi:unnamed protein product [Leuciscus chuanchicus]